LRDGHGRVYAWLSGANLAFGFPGEFTETIAIPAKVTGSGALADGIFDIIDRFDRDPNTQTTKS